MKEALDLMYKVAGSPFVQHIRKQLPSEYVQNFPKFCYHYKDAPCIENCPENAL